MLFGKRDEFTLGRVRDNVTFREGNETIDLSVDSDANSLVTKLMNAQKVLNKIGAESTDEERKQAAKGFAEAMFGAEQTQKLFDFYRGNSDCVVTICGIYFADGKNGLARKITKVQKRAK